MPINREYILKAKRTAAALVAATLLLLGSVACGGGGGDDQGDGGDIPTSGDVLVLGDSIMTWNQEEGASISQVMQSQLARTVSSAAESGATLLDSSSIPSQYRGGSWNWVVVIGGGNDLNERCQCGDCSAVVNQLIGSAGNSGAFYDLVSRISANNSKVMLTAYYPLQQNSVTEFSNCGDELIELNIRLPLLAQQQTNVYFAASPASFSGTDSTNYDIDGFHPSVTGSRLMAENLVTKIRDAEQTASP